MKTYLEIPYSDIKEAKFRGARFDMSTNTWYCPDGVDLERFYKWLPKKEKKFYDILKRSRKTKKLWINKA